MKMIDEIKSLSNLLFDDIVAIRRHLHMYPELSFKEEKTSRYIKSILKKWNIDFTEGYVNTGILVVLEGCSPKSKCVALRADFDALPIIEENEISYCSKNIGVMHACGHDAHTASMLGALKILDDTKESWNGTIKFIFQPAEERLPGGAKQMIAEGVLENPSVDNIIAQHVLPELEVGKVGFRPGIYMASTDEIYIEITGIGGHAALPQNYNNPIISSSTLIIQLNNLFLKKEHLNSIFAIGFIEGNGSTNVIPNKVNLMGTFRALDEDFRIKSHRKIQAIVDRVAKDYNVQIDLEIRSGYPALFNDIQFTEKHILNAGKYLGENNVVKLPIRMTAEDFSYFANASPSCFYRLGTGNQAKGITHGLHTSKFNIDEEALRVGMGLIAFLAIS
jgi:amidohydrolase